MQLFVRGIILIHWLNSRKLPRRKKEKPKLRVVQKGDDGARNRRKVCILKVLIEFEGHSITLRLIAYHVQSFYSGTCIVILKFKI